MDAYLDIQGQANRQGHFFVVDTIADGLRRVCESDHPFDSTTIDGGTPSPTTGNGTRRS